MEESLYIPLNDVDSEHCALLVQDKLNSIEGIKESHVELNNARAKITIIGEPHKVIANSVDAIRNLGYGVPTLIKQYPVMEMTCAACANSVETTLSHSPGVLNAQVNYATQSVKIEMIPGVTDGPKLKKIVQGVGYDLLVDEEENEYDTIAALKEQHYKKMQRKFIGAMIFSVPLFIIGMFYMNIPYANYIMWGLSTPMLFYFGNQFFIGAWKQLKNKSANMDTLVAMSTGTAYVFSVLVTLFPSFFESRGLSGHVYFEAAGIVIAFILLGKLLEERAKGNTSSAIRQLMGLQSNEVMLVIDGNKVLTPLSQVEVGDVVLVRPGEKIAVDGTVIDGASYVDESMISGEPIAVAKTKGSVVYSGTINQKGSFEFKADKVGGDTLLSQIIKMVQIAQGSKAPVQRLVDKIASIFVPIVIGIAILSFILWNVLGEDHAFLHGFVSFVTVLVIACPCALGLATPTAIMVGIGKGAEQGILIKDAESLERAQKVNAVILDKTGTITEGKPVVNGIQIFGGDKAGIENILFSMESNSDHPLAQAVISSLKDRAQLLEGLQIENIVGKGIQAQYDGSSYFLGSPTYIEETGIFINESVGKWMERYYEEANTVILLSNQTEVLAALAITDQIKESSREAIQRMHDMQVDVYMLTGDNAHTASAVAKSVGITHFVAHMMPSDKAEFVEKLQAQGKVVAMVGDGINDSNALAQADVGIAMGQGSDIAIDVAKMVIISSDLSKIPTAIRLSKDTVKTLRQNLFWAFIYNIIGIPIAAGLLYPINGFLLDPMIAGAAMALSSVSVVGNSLRLKWKK